jgi:hypothetical protein
LKIVSFTAKKINIDSQKKGNREQGTGNREQKYIAGEQGAGSRGKNHH